MKTENKNKALFHNKSLSARKHYYKWVKEGLQDIRVYSKLEVLAYENPSQAFKQFGNAINVLKNNPYMNNNLGWVIEYNHEFFGEEVINVELFSNLFNISENNLKPQEDNILNEKISKEEIIEEEPKKVYRYGINKQGKKEKGYLEIAIVYNKKYDKTYKVYRIRSNKTGYLIKRKIMRKKEL